ncbi:hypothetical protein [Serratia fonticola]|uniref:Lipoprotein n=2 Tax=Serratia TaxID=613 RepID=A0AAW3WYL5_SERFO|nr:hypothetical protein [Serratia fonticola]MBC3215961.1 hypothetical protein [Serratia fonticola]NYA16484.1 hypothetical protein [Serratia fonticola]NYA36594.1 hypothetical protein [Serratia fonticola]
MYLYVRPTAYLTLLVVSLTVAGCSTPPKGTTSSNSRSFAATPEVRTEAERLQRCSAELEAQKTVNREQYDKQRAEFDRLMSGAAQYATVRGRVDGVTQDTVDAMYRFRVNLLCASINQSVLTNLAERGEQEAATK